MNYGRQQIQKDVEILSWKQATAAKLHFTKALEISAWMLLERLFVIK